MVSERDLDRPARFAGQQQQVFAAQLDQWVFRQGTARFRGEQSAAFVRLVEHGELPVFGRLTRFMLLIELTLGDRFVCPCEPLPVIRVILLGVGRPFVEDPIAVGDLRDHHGVLAGKLRVGAADHRVDAPGVNERDARLLRDLPAREELLPIDLQRLLLRKKSRRAAVR